MSSILTGSTISFDIRISDAGDGLSISVSTADRKEVYSLEGRGQEHYAALFNQLARDFGTRELVRSARLPDDTRDPPWRPLLTGNLSDTILSGYGDPAVVKAADGYALVATSNDAPDAFPILRSKDLENWVHQGFVFPAGATPDWAVPGGEGGDFWAPEIAAIGDEYWLAYTARDHRGSLCIGLARSASPTGPWTDIGRPLLSGGVIDGHIFVDGGEPYLFWKEDRNGIWPSMLATLLDQRPELIDRIFATAPDRRTAAFAAAISGWAAKRSPIERFFLMQPLIAAAVDAWPTLRSCLAAEGAQDILEAMQTPILAQRLSDDGTALVGSPATIIANDLDWEGHVVEGPFVWKQDGRYWLFYAANDFTDPAYGIGVAVSDHVLGPYSKQGQALLGSSPRWTAPGHPSVAPGPDGEPHIFFHAFFPGTGGYNVFRALLTALLRFAGGRVEIAQ